MYNLKLSKLQNINYQYILARFQQQNLTYKTQYLSEPIQPDAGFSLVEIITVVLMIGILATIALPSWAAFVNRQRVNKANDAILAAIQEAQRQAKQKKLSYSVSFKVDSQIAKIVIHPDSKAATDIDSKRWQTLGADLYIQSGKLQFLTNLSSKNTAGAAVSEISSTPRTITFDYMGTLTNPNFGTPPSGSTETPGIKVVVSANNTKRCVILKTILGATLTDKDSKCN